MRDHLLNLPKSRNPRRTPLSGGCIGYTVFIFSAISLSGLEKSFGVFGIAGIALGLAVVSGYLFSLIAELQSWYSSLCKHGRRREFYAAREITCPVCLEEIRKEEEEALKAESERREKDLQARRKREEKERKQVLARRKQQMEKVGTLSYLRNMPPIDFERFVHEIYRRKGWEVEATKQSGDDGIDGLLRKGSIVKILQCKRYTKAKIGAPVLRDFVGSIIHAKASGGIIVTTTKFSNQAKNWVSKLDGPNVELVDHRKLLKLVEEAFSEEIHMPEHQHLLGLQSTDEEDLDSFTCPECGRKISSTQDKYGLFWYCPNCKWKTSRQP